ncbi:MAG: acyltransferase family protein [Barnesiella sp.]|nr:acyltransferase family protein [Barnesiella sp.]
MQKNNRIQYIDALRGFAMLLVVYGHVCTKLLVENGVRQSVIKEIIALFHMPLFFFVSGIFVYSVTYSWAKYKRQIYNRVYTQFVPTLIFWLLFCLTFTEVTIGESLKDHFKSGYWFTFVAVELFMLYSPMFLLFSSKNFGLKKRNWVLAAFTLLLLSVGFVGDRFLGWNKTSLWGILSLSDLFLYIPYFYLGIFFKMNSDKVLNIMSNKYFVIACLIVFISSLSLPMNFLIHLVCAIAAIVIVHYIFWSLFRKSEVRDSKFAHYLEYIGTMTLEIYLLHYFVIESIKLLPGGGLQMESLKNTVMEFPVYMLCSIIIILCCFAIVYLIKAARLYNIVFPKTRKSMPELSQTINRCL